ncbi:MAG TPA: hypothetical protein DCS93_03755 [Microscillaceae bacterium]|nr:hypothetical protein [Microscillaceae bacterium]
MMTKLIPWSALLFILVGIQLDVWGQDIKKKPLTRAEKAIAEFESRPRILDSLTQVYTKRWTFGVSYGQHFISGFNQASPDTITFADFTSRRAVFGIEASRFITNRWQLSLGFNLLLLPRNQEIGSIVVNGPNGTQIEGKGSGGAMINFGIGAKYFLLNQGFTRPYLGFKLGQIRAVAKGGKGGVTFGQGRFQEVNEQRASYGYLNLSAGFTHRPILGLMLDFNLSYSHTNQSESIGGITSPGGLTGTLTLHFMINTMKK